MKRKLPDLRGDDEAEAFVAQSDLTEYDFSAMRIMRFELRPKDDRVNMRLPRPLLDAVKAQPLRPGFLINASSAKYSRRPCSRARRGDTWRELVYNELIHSDPNCSLAEQGGTHAGHLGPR
jgi:predicted DNA binding CopG/RHH family protein